jgi:hypothetical protein
MDNKVEFQTDSKEGQINSISFIDLLLLFASGASLGWMMGMTIEKVVAGILTTILTAIITIITYLAGIKDAPTTQSTFYRKVDIKPVTLLIIGMGLGGALGIWTRTHNLLGIEEAQEDYRIVGALGLQKQDVDSILAVYGKHIQDTIIIRRLFDLNFPLGFQSEKTAVKSEANERSANNSPDHKKSLFYNDFVDICKELCKADSSEQRRIILKQKSNSDYLRIKTNKEQIEQKFTKKCGCEVTL